MDQFELDSLRGEKTFLERTLKKLPERCVIDRLSLEARLEKVNRLLKEGHE